MSSAVSQISELCITFNTREYSANINPHPLFQDSGQKKSNTLLTILFSPPSNSLTSSTWKRNLSMFENTTLNQFLKIRVKSFHKENANHRSSDEFRHS